MKLIQTKTLSALAAAVALVAAGCGDDDAGSGSASRPGNEVDRAFVADMVPHHEAAIEMAAVAKRRGQSAFVKQLAADITASQGKEIETMRREDEALELAGVKIGSLGVPEDEMGMDHDEAMLKSADPFDPAFVEMMIPHHEGAIEMAKAEIAKGEDPELKALAQEIIDAQRREIVAMRKHLRRGSSGGAMEGHSTGRSGSG